MPTLLVMRHAKSAWDTGEVDHERPLNGRGRRQAQAAGEYLVDSHPRIDRVLCSTSKRTRQTLDRILDVGLEVGEITYDRQIYGAGTAAVLPLLSALSDDVEVALLLGHWPGVEELVEYLGVPDETPGWERLLIKYVTSGIATLEFSGTWADLGPRRARLTDFLAPGRDE